MSSNNRKKIIPLFGSILIVIMLLSTVTAVPQQHGSILNDQIDKKQQLETFVDSISELEENNEGAVIYAHFLLNVADNLLDQLNEGKDSIQLTEAMVLESLPNADESMNADGVMIQAENTLTTLQLALEDLTITTENEENPMDISIINTLISLLISFIRNNIGNGDSSIGNGRGLLSILKTIFGVLGSILGVILKALFQGVSILIGGIIKAIVALVTIVILIIAGFQTVLTIGAFFLIFMGFMSNIGLRAFSIIASPIFALLSAQFSISVGKLLGGISMALFSVLGFLVFFALPLLLIAGLIFLLGDGLEDFDFGFNGGSFDPSNVLGDGPIYMFISVLSYLVNQ
jgi:hypothetical protein